MSIIEKGLESEAPRKLGEVPINHPAQFAKTLVAEDAVGFGRAVMLGTAGDQGKIYAGASKAFEGVSAKSFEASDIDNEAYSDGDVMGVIDEGYVQVYVEEAVSKGDPVRVRHTADTGKYAGDFATTADAGKTALLVGAEFASETTAAGIAAIKLTPPFETTDDV